MNATLLKSLLALVPVGLLMAWSARVYAHGKTPWSLLQLAGAGGVLIVIFAHLCEGLHLFEFMQWGQPHSVGHYLDFASAVVGLPLLVVGLVMQLVTKRRLTPS